MIEHISPGSLMGGHVDCLLNTAGICFIQRHLQGNLVHRVHLSSKVNIFMKLKQSKYSEGFHEQSKGDGSERYVG